MRRGQTIIEMVVALSVLTIGFLGIVALINTSLGLNRVVADNYRATYLAAEGIEIVKSIIMTNTENHLEWCVGLPQGNYELDYHLEFPLAGGYTCATPYPGLRAASDIPLSFHPTTHFYDYDSSGSTNTDFYRTVTISYEDTPENQLGTDKMIVQSIVRWKDKTGDNNVNLIDYFYNPPQPNP